MLHCGGDLIVNVTEHLPDFKDIHGSNEYGARNQDGLHILHFFV